MVDLAGNDSASTNGVGHAAAPKNPNPHGPPPNRWWQWILVYPTLGISLLTAAPHWLDATLATFNKVNNRTFAEAKLQADLWNKNLPCTAFPLNYTPTKSQVQEDATICDSGDIFVRASTGDNQTHFYWVPVERIIGKETGAAPVIGAAHAAEAPLGGARLSHAVTTEADDKANLLHRVQMVICQRVLDPRHIMRRISTPQGCFDQIVDTYTGQIVQTMPAPCGC